MGLWGHPPLRGPHRPIRADSPTPPRPNAVGALPYPLSTLYAHGVYAPVLYKDKEFFDKAK